MNETLDLPLTAAEEQALLVGLAGLLRRQAIRYGFGESTTLPAETAEELLASVCYFLALRPGDALRARQLLQGDLEQEMERGRRRAVWYMTRCRKVWEHVCPLAPAEDSLALRESLLALDGYFRTWDGMFFAHALPAGLDYPLLCPAEEGPGPEYALRWLNRLWAELRLLSRFDGAGLRRVWAAAAGENYCQVPMDLLYPAACVGVGLVLLKRDPWTLELTAADREALQALLRGLPPEERQKRVSAAARQLVGCSAALPTGGLLAQTLAAELLHRLEAALPTGDLSGIFPG